MEKVFYFLSLFLGHDMGIDERTGLLKGPPVCLPYNYLSPPQFYTHCETHPETYHLCIYGLWMPVLASLFTSVIWEQTAWCYMKKALRVEVTVLNLALFFSECVFLGKSLNFICKVKLSPRSFPMLRVCASVSYLLFKSNYLWGDC